MNHGSILMNLSLNFRVANGKENMIPCQSFKVKSVPSAGKKMVTVFWDYEGILQIEWLPEKTTIKSDYYTVYPR